MLTLKQWTCVWLKEHSSHYNKHLLWIWNIRRIASTSVSCSLEYIHKNIASRGQKQWSLYLLLLGRKTSIQHGMFAVWLEYMISVLDNPICGPVTHFHVVGGFCLFVCFLNNLMKKSENQNISFQNVVWSMSNSFESCNKRYFVFMTHHLVYNITFSIQACRNKL